MRRLRWSMTAMCALAAALPMAAQDPAGQQQQQQQQSQSAPQARLRYSLGANDQILLRSAEVEEINDKPFRIDERGILSLPLIGEVEAEGLSLEELERELVRRYSQFVVKPQITASLVQFRGAPIFIVGAFARPGIYAMEGERSLVQMIGLAGGLQPGAGRVIRVTRKLESGPIPLDSARTDQTRKVSVVEIGLRTLQESVNPPEDILLAPYDVITVDTLESLYVTGQVARSGVIDLRPVETMTLAKALAVSGGMQPGAASRVVVLRQVLSSTRRAPLKVNAKAILNGQANDFPLLPSDIVYVPRSPAFYFNQMIQGTVTSLPYFLLGLALR